MENSLLNQKLALQFKGKLESTTLNNYLNNTEIVALNLISFLNEYYSGSGTLSVDNEEIDLVNFYKKTIPYFSIKKCLEDCYNKLELEYKTGDTDSGKYLILKRMDELSNYSLKEEINIELFSSKEGLTFNNEGKIYHEARPSGYDTYKGKTTDCSSWGQEFSFVSFGNQNAVNSSGHINKELTISKVKIPSPTDYQKIVDAVLSNYVDGSYNPSTATILDVNKYDYIILFVRGVSYYYNRWFEYIFQVPFDFYATNTDNYTDIYLRRYNYGVLGASDHIQVVYDAGNLFIKNWSISQGVCVIAYGIS